MTKARMAAALAATGLSLLLGCGEAPRSAEPTARTDWSKVVDPRTLEAEPLEFKVPGVERLVLENGLVVYLMEDHMLPLVKIYAAVRTGAYHAGVPAPRKRMTVLGNLR